MEHNDTVGRTDVVTTAGEVVHSVEQAGPREGRAKRRTFTAEYKRGMVAEYDAAPKGTKGALCVGSGCTTPTSRSGGPRSRPAPSGGR